MTILEKKAEENYYTALYAEKEKMFNVAVSRFYYCALLAAKDYLINKKGIPEEELKSPPDKPVSTHSMIINRTNHTLANDPSSNYWMYPRLIKWFYDLKDKRNDYEYGVNSYCDEKLYRNDHKMRIGSIIKAFEYLKLLNIRR